MSTEPIARFAELLRRHLNNGTHPSKVKREPWTYASFADRVRGDSQDIGVISDRSVSNWLRGKTLPRRIEPILDALFGDNAANSEAREELYDAFLEARNARYDSEKQHADSNNTPDNESLWADSITKIDTTFLNKLKKLFADQLLTDRLKEYYSNGLKERSVELVFPSEGKSKFHNSRESITLRLNDQLRSSDYEVAKSVVSQQLQSMILDIAIELSETIQRERSGYHERLNDMVIDFYNTLKLETNELTENITRIYVLVIRLSRYSEYYTSNLKNEDFSLANDSSHGLLVDLVRISSIWLRQFPTIVNLDDEADKTLLKTAIKQI